MLVPEKIETELAIIGAGMAGVSAAVFAAHRGIPAVLVGGAGALEYTTGLLDLVGALDSGSRYAVRPFQALDRLRTAAPRHPFVHITDAEITDAFSVLVSALKTVGLEYTGLPKSNQVVMTGIGTLKPSFRLPKTMAGNGCAVKEKPPALILDFKGLREFSAAFVCNMQQPWRGLGCERIPFPGMEDRPEVLLPQMAMKMARPDIREALISRIRPLLGKKRFLGLPAMLGIDGCSTVLAHLEAELNATVFEIPTTPVSVPGIRLKQALFKVLEGSSVQVVYNLRVHDGVAARKGFCLKMRSDMNDGRIEAKNVILATGRFLGRGLRADVNRIAEPLFGLPVHQPPRRDLWHSRNYFDPQGHPVNRAGIETDSFFRPVDGAGRLVHPNLYAVGSILAHQDWMRTRSGAGLSVSTACKAVNHVIRQRRSR